MHRLQSALLAAVAVVSFASVASAADMPTKAPMVAPIAAPMYDWSGFYIGGDAGWQGSTIDLSSPDSGPLSYSPRHSSFALGGFLGYQHQFGQVVLGVEGGYMSAFGDVSFATPTSTIFRLGGTAISQAKLKDIWSVGARAGWAMGQWMPYVTGGYANGSFQFNVQNPFTNPPEQANARNGGAYFGGGFDWAAWNNWILGLEYRHYAFSSKSAAATISGFFFENVNFAPKTDTVMARVSYKFDWPGL